MTHLGDDEMYAMQYVISIMGGQRRPNLQTQNQRRKYVIIQGDGI
jgi:hypothetical protein